MFTYTLLKCFFFFGFSAKYLCFYNFQQNINQSETEIGIKKLLLKLYEPIQNE